MVTARTMGGCPKSVGGSVDMHVNEFQEADRMLHNARQPSPRRWADSTDLGRARDFADCR